MASAADRTLLTHFADLDDPRVERTKLHPLINILTIALCAVICGAESWDDIAAFGRARAAWFGTFLTLPYGIPSHDTFNRVFSLLAPEALRGCFLNWVQPIAQVTEGEVVSIDGKRLCSSGPMTLKLLSKEK